MEHLPHTFIKHLRSISLTEKERGELRVALLAKMRESTAQRPVPSPWSHLFFSKRAQASCLSVIIVLGYGSSATLAAEGALPGDILYPIKTKVAEPVARLVAATSPAAEAKFETKLLERRLEEAETLETGKKLDQELKQEVRKVIREQSLKAKSKIKDFEEGGDAVPAALTVATSTPVVATSTPKQVVPENKKQSNKSDSDDKERGKSSRALNAVLEKHERILDQLDLHDEKSKRPEKIDRENGKNNKEEQGRD
ncbi:MAG: hypothetical protein Q7J45_00305 [bacterium]|nr:hypothetical protein [bacterium]